MDDEQRAEAKKASNKGLYLDSYTVRYVYFQR